MLDTQAAPGDPIGQGELVVQRARDVARLVATVSPPYLRLLECRRRAGAFEGDLLVLEVEVELPQRPVHDIRRHEMVAVTFLSDDRNFPEVEALRTDFPQVPHLNLRANDTPKSLCLYAEPWEDLKLRWSAGAYLERIREWLARTARGELHEPDQPLEPFFLRARDTLVLSRAAIEDAHRDQPTGVWARECDTEGGSRVLLAETAGGSEGGADDEFVIMAVKAEPRTAGVIRRTPTSLAELHDLLMEGGDDLIAQIRERFAHWSQRRDLLDKQLLLLLVIPQTRSEGAPEEALEVRGFRTEETVSRVGCEIDLWELRGDSLGRVMVPDPLRRGAAVELSMLNVVHRLSRAAASALNGVDGDSVPQVIAVGVGALGSQVCLNLARAGWGQWTYVDEDYLLPHNLARHALPSFCVGMAKASMLTVIANGIVAEDPLAAPIVANVLHPGASADQLDEALGAADLILDMSASVPTARALVHDFDSNARRISAFLSPSGTDLVVLAEDVARELRLDSLEMQYYRSLSEEPGLSGHLRRPNDEVRYGQSCRDVSFVIPQELVSLHASIAAGFARQVAEQSSASISIFRADPTNLTVSRVDVPTSAVTEQQLGGWRLVSDEGLLEQVARLRLERLPNETGGVLLGTIDAQRRIAYVVDALPSPPDSKEWPTSYIRGTRGLAAKVARLRAAADDAIDYVGEWHSHPDGAGVSPSPDDREALSHLVDLRASDGLPGAFLIVGEDDASWQLATLEDN